MNSRRIAARAFSRVPASKRGEVLVMKRMCYLDRQTRPSTVSKDAYDNIFVDQLNPCMLRQCDCSFQTHKKRDRGAAHAGASDRR